MMNTLATVTGDNFLGVGLTYLGVGLCLCVVIAITERRK